MAVGLCTFPTEVGMAMRRSTCDVIASSIFDHEGFTDGACFGARFQCFGGKLFPKGGVRVFRTESFVGLDGTTQCFGTRGTPILSTFEAHKDIVLWKGPTEGATPRGAFLDNMWDARGKEPRDLLCKCLQGRGTNELFQVLCTDAFPARGTQHFAGEIRFEAGSFEGGGQTHDTKGTSAHGEFEKGVWFEANGTRVVVLGGRWRRGMHCQLVQCLTRLLLLAWCSVDMKKRTTMCI